MFEKEINKVRHFSLKSTNYMEAKIISDKYECLITHLYNSEIHVNKSILCNMSVQEKIHCSLDNI